MIIIVKAMGQQQSPISFARKLTLLSLLLFHASLYSLSSYSDIEAIVFTSAYEEMPTYAVTTSLFGPEKDSDNKLLAAARRSFSLDSDIHEFPQGQKLMQANGIAPDNERVWFSQLYGMSDNITFNLAAAGYNAAKYLPYGPVKAVIPYLLRRAEENTAIAGQAGREVQLFRRELERRGLR